MKLYLKNYPCLVAKFLITGCLLLPSTVLFAQKKSLTEKKNWYKEIEDDAYVEGDLEGRERGPAYRVATISYFTEQVNIDTDGNDIIGDAGNEPSLAVDPTNPNRIVIGWRQFDFITNNFRQAGNAYSLDGGYSWVNPGVLNQGVFRSDPVLDFDMDGNLYYNSLRGTFDCDVYSITDGGQDWGNPVPAKGGDKQWMRIDRSGGIGDGNNYSYWNSSFTTCAGNFTRSIDNAQSFEDCLYVDGDPIWGTLAVDSEGTLYLVGEGNSGLIVVKSTTAKDPASPVTFDAIYSVDLDGYLDAGISVNPQGLLGQAWIDVDISGGAHNGNVYVLASVARNSISDPGDVMFAKSIDGGVTFSAPTRINTDIGTTATQWFGTMSVAPNGRIDVVWLDTRDATNDINSVLYYSFSEDQGDSWSDNEAISIEFNPSLGYPQQQKMGDYFDMISDDDFAHLAWANTINGGQDVYYTRISPYGILGVEDLLAQNPFHLVTYPNPFDVSTTLEFTVKEEERVRVEIFDIHGRKLNTLLDEVVSGKQQIGWDGTSAAGSKLAQGLYFVSLNSQSKRTIIKVLLE